MILIGCDFIRRGKKDIFFEEILRFPFFPGENSEKISTQPVKIGNLPDLLTLLNEEKKSQIFALTRYEKVFSAFLEDNQVTGKIRVEHTRMSYKSWMGFLP